MEKKSKENLLIVIIGICLFAALMHLTTIIGFTKKIIGLILPIIVGGILALFINVPMSGLEKRIRRLFSKSKKQPSSKAYRIASFILTLICIVLVLSLVFTLLIPEMIRSLQSLTFMLETRIPEWMQYLDTHNINAEWLENFLAGIDLDQMLNTVSGRLDMLLASIVDTVSSAVSIVMTAAFGLIIGIYMVLDKERIHRHSNKFLYSYLKPSWADRISQFCRRFRVSFANFLSGQCGEAVILGTLMCFAFVVFKLPYASLVGVLTAVCAIIPYVGAFISCVISIFLALIINPTLAIRCMVVYLIVQFIENQFIYPRVVGGSVGLPPLYTLIAAMIGGKLFGILGILFFIPLASVFVEFLKDGAKKRGIHKNTEVHTV